MLYIHGIGHYHPDNCLDNHFFEQLGIDTDDEWITSRVGIKQRRTVLDLNYIRQTYNQDPQQAAAHMQLSSAQTAKQAVMHALERAHLTVDDIGLVIAGCCSPTYSLPANACTIAAELGLSVPAFDISSACSSFANHLHVINSMQVDALPDYILLVIPENWTTTIDYRDRSTAVLIGDASVATIVSKKQVANAKLTYSCFYSDPSGYDKVYTKTGAHFQQTGKAVQKFAIKKTLRLVQELREQSGIDPMQHYFIGHQANLLMLKSVCQHADIAADKHLYNVDQYGNCGAASAPSVLSQHWSQFKADDELAIAVVGSGLSWGGVSLQWGRS